MDLNELRLLLEKALHDPVGRAKHIQRFQTIVWNAEELDSRPDVDELLRELAYNLDYYQPDERIRADEPSLYGDEQLEDEIRSVLSRLPQG